MERYRRTRDEESRIKIEWNRLLRLANKYRRDAEKCLEHKAYFAGLVALRAALEAILIARLLLIVLIAVADDEEFRKEAEEAGVDITDDAIVVPEEKIGLGGLIETYKRMGLLDEKAAKAAHRIREWGNRIHCFQVFKAGAMPSVRKRDLQRRFNDLNSVVERLEETL